MVKGVGVKALYIVKKNRQILVEFSTEVSISSSFYYFKLQ